MADRLASSGRKWEEVVHDPDFLSRPDFERIEADLLATGYRFEMSAVVSLKESPEKYKPVAEREVAESSQTDELGRAVVGSGANVFRADHDVTGTARFVSSVEKVMELLSEGVPEDTIAVIDDSGGTLTAPILGEFAGVICLGGTVRSHLGILTREHGVPCLMAATLDGLRDGDEVEVEYSRPAADAYATAEDGAEHRARIIKLS
ncbi:MAG TPA: PEP-utilizing enzyme [Solirubrobacteraceae bacterium]|jgi:phosphohistidine swiveling domain-containing protein|nr:PEP-utilizing enzyme [Solirubrobacteraceae bacterium]